MVSKFELERAAWSEYERKSGSRIETNVLRAGGVLNRYFPPISVRVLGYRDGLRFAGGRPPHFADLYEIDKDGVSGIWFVEPDPKTPELDQFPPGAPFFIVAPSWDARTGERNPQDLAVSKTRAGAEAASDEPKRPIEIDGLGASSPRSRGRVGRVTTYADTHPSMDMRGPSPEFKWVLAGGIFALAAGMVVKNSLDAQK